LGQGRIGKESPRLGSETEDSGRRGNGKEESEEMWERRFWILNWKRVARGDQVLSFIKNSKFNIPPASGSFELMPGLTGGDVLGGGGGKVVGTRSDADAEEVEAVGIEANAEGGILLGVGPVVDVASGEEEVHLEVVEMEVADLAELQGELGTARAVARVAIFVFPAGVVEEREQADHLRIGVVDAGQIETVAHDGEPMGGAMHGVLPEPELRGNQVPEGVGEILNDGF